MRQNPGTQRTANQLNGCGEEGERTSEASPDIRWTEPRCSWTAPGEAVRPYPEKPQAHRLRGFPKQAENRSDQGVPRSAEGPWGVRSADSTEDRGPVKPWQQGGGENPRDRNDNPDSPEDVPGLWEAADERRR